MRPQYTALDILHNNLAASHEYAVQSRYVPQNTDARVKGRAKADRNENYRVQSTTAKLGQCSKLKSRVTSRKTKIT